MRRAALSVLLCSAVLLAALRVPAPAAAAQRAPVVVDCGLVGCSRPVSVKVDGQKVALKEARLLPRVASASAPACAGGLTEALRDLLRKVARALGLNWRILEAVARAESGGNHAAVSPKGAVGVMQLMPATARALGVNPYDLYQNVLGGARYLKMQLDRFGGNVVLALAAYNAGPGAVERYGGVPPYEETRTFVARVLAFARAI